jgi:hypothetical protein
LEIGGYQPLTEEEFDYYHKQEGEPNDFIKSVMKGTSREEMLMAEENFKNYIGLVFLIADRKVKEKQSKVTEGLYDVPIVKKIHQAKLF